MGKWKETVREVYDIAIRSGDPISPAAMADLIERRHRKYFAKERKLAAKLIQKSDAKTFCEEGKP